MADQGDKSEPRLPPPAPIDRLTQDARVDQLSLTPADTEPEAVFTARENVARWLGYYRVSMGELARMIGISRSTLSDVLGNRYKSNPEPILRKAEAAISEWFRRRGAPQKGHCVMTRIAREIFTVVRTVSKLRGIGTIVGVSGIGKSMTIQTIVQTDFPSAILVEVNPGCARPLDFLRAILAGERSPGLSSTMRARTGHWGQHVRHTADAFNLAVNRLAGSGRLIIIDEAENLSNDTFNVLRQLHDATGCPVALVGRPPLQDRISRTIRDPSIGGSLVGRICIQHTLEPKAAGGGGDRWLFTADEVRAVLAGFKVRYTGEAGHWLAALANVAALEGQQEAGALRYALKVMEVAITISGGEPVTLSMLRQANSLLKRPEWARMADHLAGELARQVKAVG